MGSLRPSEGSLMEILNRTNMWNYREMQRTLAAYCDAQRPT